ncbi:hypothetical protein [Aestuariibaculum marinum]|uniref:Uncharacterized protein n=1 Tax=Aestuariibaculum marinum TaxID=2683592 RepID=A0A8J6Q0A8_9FLAO|nr:hypothetical protein [Aestuariibaculum marinum]MBD0825532.1 hypothetical protein [Aestuariibaculum marinum]
MEKPIFDLLIEISKNDFIDNEDKSNITTRDKLINRAEKQRQLDYLLSEGLVSRTNEIYIITEYGYHIAQFNSWKEYLSHKKALIQRQLKKEKYDLYISWFQSKTGWFPYLVSIIGVVISLYALKNSKEKSLEKLQTTHKETANKQLKDIDSSTKNIQNEKAVDMDTFRLNHQKNTKSD